MIGVSGAFTNDFFALEFETLLFLSLNVLWAMIVFHGLIVHRSLAAAYLFAVIWGLTVCLYLVVPALTKVHLSLVESFFLLCTIVTGAQVIFDLICTFGAALGPAQPQDKE